MLVAAGDGHTFGTTINGPLTTAQRLMADTGFGVAADIAPVTLIATSPLVLAVSADDVCPVSGIRQETARWLNNRAENAHLPFRRRERAMLRFRRMRSLQKFASVHTSVSNHFNLDRSLSSRPLFKANRAAALAEWRGLCAA